ncbi:hypothetical protein HVTV-2_gp118 [Haloarcula virus HVTV-2]|nr:hypothetical protein HVTV-2_gp118 [Haloarcula virus HVTV-2]
MGVSVYRATVCIVLGLLINYINDGYWVVRVWVCTLVKPH